MAKKKKLIAVAFVIWLLAAMYLASKTFDEFRSGKPPGGADDIVSLKRIMFPSLMRDKE